MRRLDWLDPGEGASTASLEELQSEIGRTFPGDYAAFVLRHAGASNPSACAFAVADEDGNRMRSNFGAVLRLEGLDEESVLGVMRELGEQLPPSAIPVVDTGFGDYVCLLFPDAGEPTVAYYSHDRPIGNALLPLAATFSGFLDLLEIPDDE